ncbi:MAG: hypothetical protein GX288_03580 [Clostridiales bacterium]|nr:hypothetical protein [Clostridiales bacterium]
MNIKNLFSRKRKHQDKNEREKKSSSRSEPSKLVQGNFEILLESIRQIEEAKIEYQAITSYLQDMQIIDMVPKEHREAMEEAARNIVALTQERDSFHQQNKKINNQQYRVFERYEMNIPKDLPEIKSSEEYKVLIQRDIDYLEKEKQNLLNEKNEIISKQSFLRGITITTIIIILSLFSLFGIITYSMGANLTLPFLLTVLMGMAVVIYIFMESRKNKYDIKMIELKLNRIIMLTNKVKLKLVNNQNYLDYTYSKYMVNTYQELKDAWDEYIKLKEEEKRYQKNTDQLDFYNRQLIRELKRFLVSDCEVWLYQANAIIDSREMVEVRHRLILRRQKIRERIEMNEEQKNTAISDIINFQKQNPSYNDMINKMIRQYNMINLFNLA